MNIQKLKPLVNEPFIWEAFKEHIEGLIETNHKTLEQASDLLSIGRAQGEAIVLRRLLRLRDHVNGPQ